MKAKKPFVGSKWFPSLAALARWSRRHPNANLFLIEEVRNGKLKVHIDERPRV